MLPYLLSVLVVLVAVLIVTGDWFGRRQPTASAPANQSSMTAGTDTRESTFASQLPPTETLVAPSPESFPQDSSPTTSSEPSPSEPALASSAASISTSLTSSVAEPVAADGLSCPGVRCVTLVVTGDVLLHPPLWEQAAADAGAAAAGDTYDFDPLLAGQVRYAEKADFAICHLETPLGTDDGPYQGFPNFVVPPEIATSLAGTGYDGCSTASNHSFDDGTDGIDRTLDALDLAGLAHNGTARTADEAAAPTLIERSGVVIGLVSGTYGLNGAGPDESWQVNGIESSALLNGAATARAAGADLVVVAVHNGLEYQTDPTAGQRELAETLLNSPDVDFVFGHHAHVVQPLEKINGKWVAHGLGNTVAAHGIVDIDNREGLLVRVQFSQDRSGTWSTSDIAWVPSLMVESAYRWCSLIIDKVCESPEEDAMSEERIAAAVNLLDADDDGAHRLDQE